MINSRDLNELTGDARARALDLKEMCAKDDISLLVTSTYRDIEFQQYLYSLGRTVKTKLVRGRIVKQGIVTRARPGTSYHNFRMAFDVVPLVDGRPNWSTNREGMRRWLHIAQIGKSLGLQWGGDFKTIRDLPHFQYTEGKTIAMLRKEHDIA